MVIVSTSNGSMTNEAFRCWLQNDLIVLTLHIRHPHLWINGYGFDR